MSAWVIGHNIAGYLPESDTYAFAEYNDAYAEFIEMCREYADRDDEANDSMAEPDWSDEDYGSMRACVDSILRDGDDRNHDHRTGKNYAGMIVSDNDGRPISFWLVWSEDREPNDGLDE